MSLKKSKFLFAAAAPAAAAVTKLTKERKKSKPAEPGLKSSIPRIVKFDLLSRAIEALDNNRIELKSDVPAIGQNGIVRRFQYDPDVLSTMRALFPSGKEYKFRLTYSSTFSSSAGGSIAGAISFSPSVVSFPEWPSVSALFDEVNFVMCRVTLCPFNAGVAFINSPVVIAPNWLNTSTVPASASAVLRFAESEIFSPVTTAPVACVKVARAHSGRPWASISTPAVLNPLSGCYGTFDIANLISGSVTAAYLLYFQEEVVRLRSRA